MFEGTINQLKESLKRSSEGHLPFLYQVGEMIILELCYSIGPGFYHKARFWRRNIPFKTKTRYRVGRRYLELVAAINNPNYYKLSQSKVAEKALLQMFHVPTAEFLGFYHPISGRTGDGHPLTNETQLIEMMCQSNHQSAAVKLTEGSRGEGFDIIDLVSTGGHNIHSRSLQQDLPLSDYLRAKCDRSGDQGILLESVIKQHNVLARLNATSVNTLRIWARQTGREVAVKSCLLKIGGAGKLTDYSSTGGLAVPVDVKTGKLGVPLFRPPGEGESMTDGDISSKLENLEIPHWPDALRLAKKCLKVFPDHNLAGMDIAITEQGPLIVEINVEPDPIHAATCGIPTLDLLDSN